MSSFLQNLTRRGQPSDDAETQQTPPPGPPPLDDFRPVIDYVMDVSDTTVGKPQTDNYAVRYRGTLRIDSEAAYDKVAAVFHAHDYTPLFRWDGDRHMILAVPGVVRPSESNPWVNVGLFVATFASILFTGFTMSNGDPNIERPWLVALMYTVGLLSILLAHEFGHYFAARRHGAAVTLPYFLPLPFGIIGTLGAVIAMKAPIRNRRVLLDIGISGPLAGLVVAIPVVLIGLALSDITTIPQAAADGAPVTLMEGNSLLYLGLKYLSFGQLLPAPVDYGNLPPALFWVRYFFTGQPFPYGATDVTIHPLAWAGWVGLLVTGLNLIPAGQFDGGHTIYVLLGDRTKYLTWGIIAVLLLGGFVWSGWWLWAAIIYFINRRHAALLDEITALDPPRWYWAVVTIIVAVLVITPVPLVIG